VKKFYKTSDFQIRWNEPLGLKECPYAYRWVFIFFGYSIRVHKWIRSDDKRYMHSHSWDFRTFVLRGNYIDVSLKNGVIVKEIVSKTAFRKASHLHYVEVPKEGCLTILFCSKPYQKWGFWVNDRILRPLRFFDKYGHPICSEQ
jgi:hypothetical protein